MGDYEINVCQGPPPSVLHDFETLTCQLPASDSQEASHFLQVVATGGPLGAGYQLARLGVDMPALRAEYEQAVENLIREVEARRRARMDPRELARWAVEERTKIARRIRLKQGISPTVLFEIRDHVKYGLGGRTFKNMQRRAVRAGYQGQAAYEQLIRGATRPNPEITQSMVGAARYLKHGGRVILVISVATTAYTILTAPQEELERVLAEEAGGIIGGSAGSGLGVGLCLILGIASGGWGLLACGVVGGLAGGAVGAYAGDRIYYSMKDEVLDQASTQGVIDVSLLEEQMPEEPMMCY
jgi:hypothetical protein